MKPLKKWWEKKSVDNAKSNSHYKNWCVIRRISNLRHDPNKWISAFEYEYVAVVRSNAPQYYEPATGMFNDSVHVDKLTKEEAFAMAKMLNFVGEVEE